MNAVAIFKNQLDQLLKESGIGKIKSFVKYLLEKVVMITITCSNRMSAIKLFQIINTRGLELSLFDLIKSSLYSKLKDDKKKQFISTWYDIEKIRDYSRILAGKDYQ